MNAVSPAAQTTRDFSHQITHRGEHLNFGTINIGTAHPWEFSTRANESQHQYDDFVVVTPVVKSSQKDELRVVFNAMFRPPLLLKKPMQGKSPFARSISFELPGGLTGDNEQLSHKAIEEIAKKELLEETGLDAQDAMCKKLLEGMASSSGSTDETGTVVMAEIDNVNLDQLEPKEPDINQLAVFSVPLKNAYKFFKDLVQSGFSVGWGSFVGITEAMNKLKISPDLESVVKAKLHWKNKPSDPLPFVKFIIDKIRQVENLRKAIDRHLLEQAEL